MRCRRSGDGAVDRADDRGSCSPTAATTTTPTGACCAPAGITPRIARRGIIHGSGLGRHRWVVERGFAWLHAVKRLRTGYEHRADIHRPTPVGLRADLLPPLAVNLKQVLTPGTDDEVTTTDQPPTRSTCSLLGARTT